MKLENPFFCPHGRPTIIELTKYEIEKKFKRMQNQRYRGANMAAELYVIAGPTACGKTALSLELAERLGGEIVSADSMQVYKYMDIGTAKIKPGETRGIKHYLIDELYPDDDFSIAVFKRLAEKYIKEIAAKGKIPIIVGGTGFYINAALYGTQFTETEADAELRAELFALAAKNGGRALHNMLRSVDAEAAEAIHENNLKRVVRAIEYFRQTGSKISEHNKFEKTRKMVYNTRMFVLTDDRRLLYERIDRRVDEMFKAGLAGEVKGLLDMGYGAELTSMRGIGYKELADHFSGLITLDEAAAAIKINTRHYAKRQLTWFKRQPVGELIDIRGGELGSSEICDYIIQ